MRERLEGEGAGKKLDGRCGYFLFSVVEDALGAWEEV